MADRPARITVIAGVNGAGKSSILGAALRDAGGVYYNPDEEARRLLETGGARDPDEANAKAWEMGREALERAIEERLNFNFETTLGGRTITGLLRRASEAGLEVWMFYVGLSSPALYEARVQVRVSRGGHDIPHDRIVERFDTSRKNLVRLLPYLARLRMFDNSRDADPAEGKMPEPIEVLSIDHGRMVYCCPMDQVPEWARPVVAAALRTFRPRGLGGP